MKHGTINSHPLGGLAVLLLFLAPALAGCLQSSDPVEPPGNGEPTWPPLGLGLEIPDVLPEPGPFREDPGDIETLERFLLEEGRQMLEECGNPDRIDQVEAWLHWEQHTRAFSALFRQCSDPVREERWQLAQSAMRDGNEAEVRDRLHAEALEAIARLGERLDAHPGPGNAVEASLLHRITRTHQTTPNAVHGAVRFWEPYADGSHRDEFQLRNAYLGLLGARADSESIMMFMDRYPWSPACTVDRDALYDRVLAKMEYARSMGENHSLPGEDVSHSALYGQLIMDRIPQTVAAMERDWWWLVLGTERTADIHVAYWENRTQAAAWPTIQEAEYLLALHRSQGRSIPSEFSLIDWQWFLEDPSEHPFRDWHHDLDYGAVSFMGYLGVQPTWLLNLECPS